MDEHINQSSRELKKELDKCTDRIKELERQIMQSKKLVAAGRMISRIAHEINNPIAGIKYSFMLIKDAIPKNHKYYSYKDKIEYQIDKMAHIVQQMLEPYKPDHETPGEFDIIITIHDIVSLFKSSNTERDVTIDIDTCTESLEVYMAEDLIKQVLFNIIQNAIEASPVSGLVKVTVDRDEDKLKITVSDQGNGIPDKLRSRIYEPFFTTKNENSIDGSGLGLSTAKGIVESMRGTLGFISGKNMGTDFIIDLPVNFIMEKK